MSNKAEKYFASMRTTIELLDQSMVWSDRTITQVKSELRDILEKGILIYPPTLKRIGLRPDMTLKERKQLLGIAPSCNVLSEREVDFCLHMKEAADNTRKHEWSFRITQEARLLDDLGWYPFFVTLTVDPKQISPREVWADTKRLREFIRKLVNLVADEMGDPHPHKCKPYVPESNYVRYVGVVEHGKSREHHHGHFLIWLREIPSRWKADPNKGRLPKYCNERRCPWISNLWDYGISSECPANYFRYEGDIWSRDHGHVTPVDKNGKAINIGAVDSAGNYLTKYLTKESREWNHRVKSTRNLGKMQLLSHLATMPTAVIQALSWRPEKAIDHVKVSTMSSVPQSLLRQSAKRILFARQWAQGLLSLEDLVSPRLKPYIAMLRSVRDGARPERMHLPEFYDWVSQFLPAQDGYSRSIMFDAHARLAEQFPPRSYQRKTKQGGI